MEVLGGIAVLDGAAVTSSLMHQEESSFSDMFDFTRLASSTSEEGLPTVIVGFSPPFTVIETNEQWCELTGFSAKSIVGRSMRMLQGPDTDVVKLHAIITKSKDGGCCSGISTLYMQSGTDITCVITSRRITRKVGDEDEDVCRLTMTFSAATHHKTSAFESHKAAQVKNPPPFLWLPPPTDERALADQVLDPLATANVERAPLRMALACPLPLPLPLTSKGKGQSRHSAFPHNKGIRV